MPTSIFSRTFCWYVASVAVLAALPAWGQVSATPDKQTAIYQVGETVRWTITPDAGATGNVTYQVKRNGLDAVKTGEVDLAGGQQQIEAPAEQSGALLLEVGTGKTRALAGVLIDPEKIGPTLPPPADFKAFWDGKIAELHKTPINAQLTPADGGPRGVDYYKVRMDGYSGSHIFGQLAKPAGEGKHPAVLQLQWAGVYGLPAGNVVTRAQNGWLALNIEPHDLPFDESPEFYKAAAAGALKDYYHMGNSDREKSYFLRMYLSAYRAVDYLASRDDWDGKTLVVMGTSMGGQQTIVTAGLHPAVTAMMALVPSSCDAAGPTNGRAAGFPDWAAQAKQLGNDKIIETSRYFDPENFAPNVKCPALVGLGLIDETCPPAGVYAAYNQIPGHKEVVVLVHSDHQGKNGTQAAFNKRAEEWLAAMVKGEPAPVK